MAPPALLPLDDCEEKSMTRSEGGMPQNGVCHFPPVCDGLGKCTYKNMQVTVTIASCAGTEAFKVEFKWGCGQCQAAIP
jgi:hypothetical protein